MKKYPKNYFLSHNGKAHNFSQIEKECKQCGLTFMVQKHRSTKAKFCSVECKANFQKGKTASVEMKKRMSLAISGENHWNYGKRYSITQKQKLSKAHIGLNTGEKNNMWKGGVSKNKEYVSWSKNRWHQRDRKSVV